MALTFSSILDGSHIFPSDHSPMYILYSALVNLVIQSGFCADKTGLTPFSGALVNALSFVVAYHLKGDIDTLKKCG